MTNIKITDYNFENPYDDIPLEEKENPTFTKLIAEMLGKIPREFDYNKKVVEIAIDVMTRLDEEEFPFISLATSQKDFFQDEVERLLNQELDNGLIWAEDQWALMAYYQMPEEACYYNAKYDLIHDLMLLINKTIKELN